MPVMGILLPTRGSYSTWMAQMAVSYNPLPRLTPEEAKAERARYIAEWNASMNAATPEERELATLERKTRLSADELARYRVLNAQKAA